MSRIQSEFTEAALRLGKNIKHSRQLYWSIVPKLNLPLSVQDKLSFEYVELRHIMEEILELTLPLGANFAYAPGFRDTRITEVFYADCTWINCNCNSPDDTSYSFLRRNGGRSHRRNKNLSYMELEAILYLLDMHSRNICAAERFAQSVIQQCRVKCIKFSRPCIFGGEALNQQKCKSCLNKERRIQTRMLNAIVSVSSVGKILWAKLRRKIRMYLYSWYIMEQKWILSGGARRDLHMWPI